MEHTKRQFIGILIPVVIVSVVFGFLIKNSSNPESTDDIYEKWIGKSIKEVYSILGKNDSTLVYRGSKIGVWKEGFYDSKEKKYQDLCMEFETTSLGKAVVVNVYLDCIKN